MTRMVHRGAIACLLLVLALFAAACGSGEEGADAGASPTPDDAPETAPETEAPTESASADATGTPEETASAAGDSTAAAGEPPNLDELPEPDTSEPLDLTMGSTTSSSAGFPYFVAQARLASEHDGNMTMDVRETDSTGENLGLVTDGAVDFGISSVAALADAYNGEGEFEGEALPNLRLLMTYFTTTNFFLVRSDSGIENLEDLDGQPFAAGFAGAGSTLLMVEILEALDIQPDYFEGSLEDVVNAYKDGRIVGFSTSGNGLENVGPSMVDAASSIDSTLIGFTPEQAETVTTALPEVVFQTAPADVVAGSPEHLIPTNAAVYFTDESMPDETAFRLLTAIWATIEQASEETNYAPTRGHVYAETVQTSELIPLHPGAEQFYEEVGAL